MSTICSVCDKTIYAPEPIWYGGTTYSPEVCWVCDSCIQKIPNDKRHKTRRLQPYQLSFGRLKAEIGSRGAWQGTTAKQLAVEWWVDADDLKAFYSEDAALMINMSPFYDTQWYLGYLAGCLQRKNQKTEQINRTLKMLQKHILVYLDIDIDERTVGSLYVTRGMPLADIRDRLIRHELKRIYTDGWGQTPSVEALCQTLAKFAITAVTDMAERMEQQHLSEDPMGDYDRKQMVDCQALCLRVHAACYQFCSWEFGSALAWLEHFARWLEDNEKLPWIFDGLIGSFIYDLQNQNRCCTLFGMFRRALAVIEVYPPAERNHFDRFCSRLFEQDYRHVLSAARKAQPSNDPKKPAPKEFKYLMSRFALGPLLYTAEEHFKNGAWAAAEEVTEAMINYLDNLDDLPPRTPGPAGTTLQAQAHHAWTCAIQGDATNALPALAAIGAALEEME